MYEDDDLAFAMFLQEQFDKEDSVLERKENVKLPTSLVDEAWEVIDPVPDIRQLFLQFNAEYFDGLLGGVEVRWSPRMTLCAGLCSYEGRGGLCSIRLSEPLLKLRPRKDLVQTLLHEMIHALLFVTQNNKDHDAHGPEFHKHMYRINKQSGTNITVYHNFHDEVDSYRLHWWKCNGPCQKWPPFYGVVKRSMNRAPAPRDTWWDDHKRKCGGQFIKIKEPENYGKKKTNDKTKNSGAGSSKKNEKTLGSGIPSLPNFFDKMNKTKGKHSNETTDLKESSKQDDSIEKYVENPAKRQKTEKIVPFSCVGHVLGDSRAEERSKLEGEQGSFSASEINSSEHCNKKEMSSFSSQETSSVKGKSSKTRKKPVDRTDKPELTIINAFKRNDKSSCSSKTDATEGSKEKPICLCEEDTPRPSSLSHDVSCPVCLLAIPIININAHLDNCLTAT